MGEDMDVELAGEVPEIMAGEDTNATIATMVMGVVTHAIIMIIVVEKLQGMAVARIADPGLLMSVVIFLTRDVRGRTDDCGPMIRHLIRRRDLRGTILTVMETPIPLVVVQFLRSLMLLPVLIIMQHNCIGCSNELTGLRFCAGLVEHCLLCLPVVCLLGPFLACRLLPFHRFLLMEVEVAVGVHLFR
jgi:hypothetical protein